MSRVVLHEGDCLEIIPRQVADGVVVDAVITDPPYDLTATTKRFGKANAAPAQYGRDGAMARLSGGFMGCAWDSTGIAFRPETWATVATILRPGAFLLAFGGTRTWHRMVCAIEDAGFVIQDTIMFMFGTGFPKRRDMLKPAFEPICLAYKPGGKRMLQVDECRVPTNGEDMGDPRRFAKSAEHAGWSRPSHTPSVIAARGDRAMNAAETLGRWPANVIHDGSDEVVAAFPESAGQQGDVRGNEPSATGDNGIYGHFARVPFNRRGGEASAERRYDEAPGDFAMLPGARRDDGGSAARFFYSAKAGAEDRWGSRHPTVKPVELIKYLVKLFCPPAGTFLDPFAGSGTAAVAALATGRNAILCEREPQYCADIRERIAHYEGDGRHSLAVKARNRQPREQHGALL